MCRSNKNDVLIKRAIVIDQKRRIHRSKEAYLRVDQTGIDGGSNEPYMSIKKDKSIDSGYTSKGTCT